MYKIVEPVLFRIHTIDGGDICVEGYSLEDGSCALYIEDHWERKKKTVEPVLEAGKIIGFEKVSKKKQFS